MILREPSFAAPLRSARRLLEAAGIRPPRLGLLAIAAAGQALLVAPAPFLVQRAFALAVDGGSRLALTSAIAWLVLLLVGSEAVAASVKLAGLRVTKPGTERLRRRLAGAIERLPVDLVEPQSPYVHDVYVHDTERVDTMMTAAVGQILPSILLVGVLSVALAVAQPGFGLAALAAAVLVASVERLMRKHVRRALDRTHQAFGEFSRGAWSMLSGLLVTRSHAAEGHEADSRAREAAAARQASQAAARMSAVSNLLGRGTAAVVFGALLLVAALLVQSGSMSVPAMLAVTSTIALLRAPLFVLGQMAPQVQEGWRAWGRVAALLDAAAGTPHGGLPLPADTTLTLDGVACRWGRTPLFADVSFTIAPGEVVALTGPNGSGKTTLVRQILGLTAPTAGVVAVGGIPLDRLDVAAWRRAVGVVLQETWFFDGTIADNLVYGAPAASASTLNEACRVARVDAFVRELPRGLDTRLGGDGLRLSQGQRQRLAIARALVRRPRLLILDEPTNHLDDDTARAVLAAIVSLPGRPAVLLITHQVEFAAMARRVYRLVDGRLTLAQTGLTEPAGSDTGMAAPPPVARET
jgi:ABC-type multidrug transport system fused ATPase/permease subunit